MISEVRFHKQTQATPTAMQQWLREKGLDADSEEPWTLALEYIDSALANTLADNRDLPSYTSPGAFREDLDMLNEAFLSIQAQRLASRYLEPIFNQLNFYGFHTACLDVRQNSQAYQRALTELLEKAEIPDASNFASWSEQEKTAFMLKELANNRPFLLPHSSLSDSTQEVLDTFRVVKEHIDRHGPDGIGDFIVSMTRGYIRPAYTLPVLQGGRSASPGKWHDRKPDPHRTTLRDNGRSGIECRYHAALSRYSAGAQHPAAPCRDQHCSGNQSERNVAANHHARLQRQQQGLWHLGESMDGV